MELDAPTHWLLLSLLAAMITLNIIILVFLISKVFSNTACWSLRAEGYFCNVGEFCICVPSKSQKTFKTPDQVLNSFVNSTAK